MADNSPSDQDRLASQPGSEANMPGMRLVDAVHQEILHQVAVRPYATVIVAAAAGYVLGSGSPRWLSRLAWDVARRTAFNQALSAFTNA
jgi:hypothetical protein